MDPATIIAIITGARLAIDGAVKLAAIAAGKGEITPEQLADIKARAVIADADWDAIVAAAKARLQED